MMKPTKKSPSTSSSFADFMNNASATKKKKVYKIVMRRVSEQQQAIVDRANNTAAWSFVFCYGGASCLKAPL